MIQNVEDVIKFLKVNKLDYWTVQVKEGDNGYVFKADEGLSFDDNVKNFRQTMELSTGSRFFLKANGGKVNKGNFYEEFKNVSGTPSVNGLPNTNTVRGFTEEEVDRKITEALEKERIRREMEAVKQENEELKQQINAINTPVNRVIAKIGDYLPQIMGFIGERIFPPRTPMQIAGMDYNLNFEPRVQTMHASSNEHASSQEPDQEHKQDDIHRDEPQFSNLAEDAENRLVNAINLWAKADPEFLEVIEFIANFAASGNKVGNGFMQFDYNQVKGLIFNK